VKTHHCKEYAPEATNYCCAQNFSHCSANLTLSLALAFIMTVFSILFQISNSNFEEGTDGILGEF